MTITIRGIKKKVHDLRQTRYGEFWQKRVDPQFYEAIFNRTPLMHEDFMRFLNRRRTKIKSILEIGCGAGIYPINYKSLFEGIEYTGLDISKPAIKYCKARSEFNFILGDFLKLELKSFDMVFSRSVIDHVYDINAFLDKIARSASKFAYISAYRGYFSELPSHRMTWNNDDGCYYNDLSVTEVKRVLLESGLVDNEFTIRKQASGIKVDESYAIGLDGYEAVIEINRRSA